MQLIGIVSVGLAAATLLTAAGQQSVVVAPIGRDLARSTLSVLRDGYWVAWWSSGQAPASWIAPHPSVNAALSWRRVSDGVEWSELRLAGDGVALRVRVIVARLDPALVRFRLESNWTASGDPNWSVDRAAPDALVSFNSGQFPHSNPWGWVVRRGREIQPPGYGPLSVGIAIDSSGAVRWLTGARLTDISERSGAVEGFQSFPRLLENGQVPVALRVEGSGVDLRHRDARLAFGQTVDGKILIALTRFDGVGGALDFVPFGLTTPEMAAVMGAIGARDAVLLDGGISSQLLIRDGGDVHRWRGLRQVPMGLVVTARDGGTNDRTR